MRAVTPFIQDWQVSAFQPSAGRLESLAYPTDLARLGMQKRWFRGEFCDLHADIAALDGDALVYYATRFKCAEAMSLALLLGYDGPVRLWVDGEARFHDPNGTNPAVTDAQKIRLEAAAGEHVIVVALGTNHGAAWGIFLRLERTDLSKAVLKKGPAFWALPEMAC